MDYKRVELIWEIYMATIAVLQVDRIHNKDAKITILESHVQI